MGLDTVSDNTSLSFSFGTKVQFASAEVYNIPVARFQHWCVNTEFKAKMRQVQGMMIMVVDACSNEESLRRCVAKLLLEFLHVGFPWKPSTVAAERVIKSFEFLELDLKCGVERARQVVLMKGLFCNSSQIG